MAEDPSEAASQLPAEGVLISLTFFAITYSVLLISALYFGSRILRKGPNFDLPVPGHETIADLSLEPAEFLPNQRPAEAQQ